MPDDLRLADGTSAYQAPGGRFHATPDHLDHERLLAAATADRHAPTVSFAAANRFIADLASRSIRGDLLSDVSSNLDRLTYCSSVIDPMASIWPPGRSGPVLVRHRLGGEAETARTRRGQKAADSGPQVPPTPSIRSTPADIQAQDVGIDAGLGKPAGGLPPYLTSGSYPDDGLGEDIIYQLRRGHSTDIMQIRFTEEIMSFVLGSFEESDMDVLTRDLGQHVRLASGAYEIDSRRIPDMPGQPASVLAEAISAANWERIACRVGERIERRLALHSPDLDRLVAFLVGVWIALLLTELAAAPGLAEARRRWERSMPAERAGQIPCWLVERGLLEPVDSLPVGNLSRGS